ncbi:MAG: winged helix-turn-helix transcriptional regulator [Candidatus Sungbacteria bacterium]|uniref:Winged helix-turn-helix transcriptional regulator n=1 Tax=Candidatus Sungiibacteriota bacterium TaxID=2750080 RepID=A0A931SBW9_9BACT|nr:winged helix-turn-helix transcriptional regulator [Candidatus Sungbacteria bacterium]
MKEKEIERSLKALANGRRLAILKFIKKEKEAAVGDIAGEIRLSFKATSRHLSVLFSANILDKDQRSLRIFYRIADDLPELIRRILLFL